MNPHNNNHEALRDAFDHRMSAALQSIEPPPGGLERLLAAMQQVQPDHAPILTPTVWSRRRWMGAAAAVVAGIAVPVTYRKFRGFDQGIGATEPGSFIADAATKAGGLIRLSTKDPSWLKLQETQTKNTLPFSQYASTKLSSFEAKGCQGYEWRGFPVGLTCFRLADGQIAHIFSISRQVFGENATLATPTAPTPVASTSNHYEHFYWSEKEILNVLVAGSPTTRLQEVHAKLQA
jgi:hypothetical protein